MSEDPGRNDTMESAPDGTIDFTFTPFAFTACSEEFAIGYSDDPEERVPTGWPEYIDYTWRKIQSVPSHEKANLFVGYSSLAVFSRQVFRTSGSREHLDRAITWAREAEEFGRDIRLECKTLWLWPALLAELLLQRFEYGQIQKDLEESCNQFRAYLHVFDHDADARGAYADMVRRKLQNSMDQMVVGRLLDECLVFAQIAEDAPHRDNHHLADRLQWHGIFLFMKSDHHSKLETLKMALSKLEQAISTGLSKVDEARAKSTIAMLRVRLKIRLPDFDIPPGFEYDLLFGDSLFSQVRKIGFRLQLLESGVEDTYKDGSYLFEAEKFAKEALESEENTQYRAFEPEILLLAGQVSEACQAVFDGERSPKLEDPAYYWARCWNLNHGPLHFRLRAIHRWSCRLFRQGKYEAA